MKPPLCGARPPGPGASFRSRSFCASAGALTPSLACLFPTAAGAALVAAWPETLAAPLSMEKVCRPLTWENRKAKGLIHRTHHDHDEGTKSACGSPCSSSVPCGEQRRAATTAASGQGGSQCPLLAEVTHGCGVKPQSDLRVTGLALALPGPWPWTGFAGGHTGCGGPVPWGTSPPLHGVDCGLASRGLVGDNRHEARSGCQIRDKIRGVHTFPALPGREASGWHTLT